MSVKNSKVISKKQGALLIVFVSFLFLLILLICLSFSQEASEFITRYISRSYILVTGFITNIIPISTLEIMVVFLIFLFIFLLVKGIILCVKGNKRDGIYNFSVVLTVLLGIITSYYLSCGLAYHRADIPIELYEKNVQKSDYLPIIHHFLDDFNACCDELEFSDNGSLVSPYSIDEINTLLIKEFDKIDDDYYSSFTPRCKPLISSFLYLEMHIAGVSFSALGEGNINALINPSDLPFTMAHEMCHIKGVMRESDANLLASYVCLNSSDPYLRFSAYRRTFFNLVDIVDFLEHPNKTRNNIYQEVDERIWNDIRYTNKYYEEHDLFNQIATFFNNLYLTIFGNGGIGAYDDNMDKEDSGEVDDNGNIIYNPIYSNTQKLYFKHYYDV